MMYFKIKIRGPDLECNFNITPLFLDRLALAKAIEKVIELVPPIIIAIIQALGR